MFAGFQIAVDAAFFVRGLERLGDLPRDGQGLGGPQGSALQAIRECRAFDELEDQRHEAVGFLQAVDGADGRMIERREQPGLTAEAGAALRVGNEMRRQEFERDLATQLGVARAIHLAHAAFAERGEDSIRAEIAAQHLRHSGEVRRKTRHCRIFKELGRVGLVPQQRLDLVPQCLVVRALFVQEGVTVLGRPGQRCVIQMGEAS
jgi:hypothetical protein